MNYKEQIDAIAEQIANDIRILVREYGVFGEVKDFEYSENPCKYLEFNLTDDDGYYLEDYLYSYDIRRINFVSEDEVVVENEGTGNLESYRINRSGVETMNEILQYILDLPQIRLDKRIEQVLS